MLSSQEESGKMKDPDFLTPSIAATVAVPSSSLNSANHGASSSSSAGYNSSNYMLPSFANQPATQANSGSNNSSTTEYLIMRMMNETGQDRDICYFLLESVNFDYDQAMEIMMQNLQVK
jgi:hypothetical protein